MIAGLRDKKNYPTGCGIKKSMLSRGIRGINLSRYAPTEHTAKLSFTALSDADPSPSTPGIAEFSLPFHGVTGEKNTEFTLFHCAPIMIIAVFYLKHGSIVPSLLFSWVLHLAPSSVLHLSLCCHIVLLVQCAPSSFPFPLLFLLSTALRHLSLLTLRFCFLAFRAVTV